MNGTLYIVATPIGNLGDISARALQILTSVDFIVAEDTRRTKRLLDRYEIETKLVSGHEHSSSSKNQWIVEQIKSGQQVALVTDAGTPGICDPGGQIVEMAAQNSIDIIPIPGPSALTAILSVTGWANEPILFLGYLPKKKGRQTLLTNLSGLDSKIAQTIVFYESPERIGKTLAELKGYLGDKKQVVLGRELTKQFEEIIRGDLGELSSQFEIKQKGQTSAQNKKGEFVVAISNS
jgi:16S rRNA (cytidine1402-2'-O)-methyltransferase